MSKVDTTLEDELAEYEDPPEEEELDDSTLVAQHSGLSASSEDSASVTDGTSGTKKKSSSLGSSKVDSSYVSFVPSSAFKDFMLRKELMRAIGDAGFEHPSQVQHESIPKAILGQDMIVQAKSGMGKTAVFVLSTLQQLDVKSGGSSASAGSKSDDSVDTIVICHTREMAFQVASEFERFSKYMTNVRIGVVYGGVPLHESRRIVVDEKPHILIGTPGRLNHLINLGLLDLTQVSRFIIDECDNLLNETDMRRQVQDIFKRTPQGKQVMMFSATISESARGICRKFTRSDVKEIFVDDKQLTLHGLQQYFVKLSEREKTRKLSDMLDNLDFNQVVVFVKSRKRAGQLNRLLRQCAFPTVCVHSDMPQPKRLALFQEFKDYKHRILVATNLFGRGIDIERVNIVVNYDMSPNSDEYLHRVGRAGRFGTKGLAITFISSEDDESVLSDVQDRFKVKILPLPDRIDVASYM